ncbi:hypothetical protein AG1IA_04997 [Rhizoctonia solani AG-1 IA]|uniref:Uncharacterized protein n=1 Tax=Thanatephorus cucumeris (strain AG1-IA) TaxID=983506 RepID=L8WW16_THACA|nr:hypothetical protein AG1IA_04997 [Rhizoctonia solani AG-1 IA]
MLATDHVATSMRTDDQVSHPSLCTQPPPHPLSLVIDDSLPFDDDSVKAESEYDQSDHEEPQYRPLRKRQRISTDPEGAQVRKRQVRGKQGRLAGLVNMPIDIFTEVRFPYDTPPPPPTPLGLPPCPPDLSEPHYLALLFSKYCTFCGQVARCRMDEVLRVRLCVPCRAKSCVALFIIRRVSTLIIPGWRFSIVHVAHTVSGLGIVPSKRRWGNECDYALKDEAERVQQKYEELSASGDMSLLEEWELETRAEAVAIREFLDIIENDRDHELRDMKRERRRKYATLVMPVNRAHMVYSIEQRLLKLGWAKEDMAFSFLSPKRKEWYSLVEQAKPLTDRIWSNLQPKLIPILEYNREARLQKEQSERQAARRVKLAQLINEIKVDQEPMLDLSVRKSAYLQGYSNSESSEDSSNVAGPSNSAESQSSSDLSPLSPEGSSPSSSSSNSGAVEPPMHTIFRDIFPIIVDALEWPVVKALYKTDRSVSDMVQQFSENRDEIEACIDNWKSDLHTRMAEMLRKDEDIEGQGQVLTPCLVVQKDDSDPFQHLSDDLKLLLRADSLFTFPQNSVQNCTVNSYDAAIAKSGYRLTLREAVMPKPYRPPVELTRIRVCTEARRVARTILGSMGLENASIVEMKSVGRGYVCGRCHDSGTKTWEELVSHYVQAKEVVARVDMHPDKMEALGVVYRDVHDPEVFPERPLVKYAPEPNGTNVPTRACTICSKDPIVHNVKGSEPGIIQHIKDVHDIAEPKLGVHYAISDQLYVYGLNGALQFEFDMDAALDNFIDYESELGLDAFWEDDLW